MTTCHARPTQDGHKCDTCRIHWDRDDECPCPRIAQDAPSIQPDRFISALAPDLFQR
jgi:hypothetical protein